MEKLKALGTLQGWHLHVVSVVESLELTLPWLPAWSWSFKLSMSETGLSLISNSYFHCHLHFTWVPLAQYTMSSTDHQSHWKSVVKLDSSHCLTRPIKLSQSLPDFTFSICEMFFPSVHLLVPIWISISLLYHNLQQPLPVLPVSNTGHLKPFSTQQTKISGLKYKTSFPP